MSYVLKHVLTRRRRGDAAAARTSLLSQIPRRPPLRPPAAPPHPPPRPRRTQRTAAPPPNCLAVAAAAATPRRLQLSLRGPPAGRKRYPCSRSARSPRRKMPYAPPPPQSATQHAIRAWHPGIQRITRRWRRRSLRHQHIRRRLASSKPQTRAQKPQTRAQKQARSLRHQHSCRHRSRLLSSTHPPPPPHPRNAPVATSNSTQDAPHLLLRPQSTGASLQHPRPRQPPPSHTLRRTQRRGAGRLSRHALVTTRENLPTLTHTHTHTHTPARTLAASLLLLLLRLLLRVLPPTRGGRRRPGEGVTLWGSGGGLEEQKSTSVCVGSRWCNQAEEGRGRRGRRVVAAMPRRLLHAR